MQYPDGSIYNGELKKGVRDGIGILTQVDGTIIKGTWKEDKFIE